ncbi:NUDIX domain protein [Metarhizium acridum CQMa 102]|uniref:NUDIX domain protein n=1 Tax=Metarhizium acridum (strain CQMa 102) TaxID=655827 RepID=E9EIQ6_METAQ|nr:NUDIX domain protein [Metarhizium acridum CQMa 102]EFY84202.1 NUDIX domain protein [Metarhizium acridum CQMa 102]
MDEPYTVSDAIPACLKCSPSEFLSSRPHLQRLMAAAMVFRRWEGAAQTLLLRRAPSDSYPLRWEIPGGSTSDRKDGSVLDGVRRELREETGLGARRMLYPVGMLEEAPRAPADLEAEGKGEEARNEGDDARTVSFWESDERHGMLRWGKVTVVVDVDEDLGDGGVVRLDEREHDRWAWATQAEVEAGRWADGEDIGFVSEGSWRSILEGFRLYGENGEKEKEREMDGPRLMTKFGGKANKGP